MSDQGSRAGGIASTSIAKRYGLRSKVIRVDAEILVYIEDHRRPGESRQAALTRLVRKATGRTNG